MSLFGSWLAGPRRTRYTGVLLTGLEHEGVVVGQRSPEPWPTGPSTAPHHREDSTGVTDLFGEKWYSVAIENKSESLANSTFRMLLGPNRLKQFSALLTFCQSENPAMTFAATGV